MTHGPKPSPPRGDRAPRQARSRRTREQILQAAVTCFEERGYEATTTALIARQGGVGIGTLYGHFADKRAILLELLDGTAREIADFVIRGLDPEAWRESEPRESVRRLIDAVFHARTVSPGIQRILWERYFKDLEFRAAVEAIERRVRAAMETLLESLKSEGRLRVDDVATAAFVIYTSVEWTAARVILGGADQAEVHAAAEATSEMVSRFLFPESPPLSRGARGGPACPPDDERGNRSG